MLLSSIEHVICDYFHISSEDIRKKTRKEKIRYPRQILFWMANYYLKRNELEITQNNTLIQLVFISELGRYYSFNHSTILHAINVINNEIDYDKRLMPIINELRMKIYLYDSSEMEVKRLSERQEILTYLYEKRQIIMDLIEKYEHLPC